ncbi:lanC-like protein 2 [Anabrus simplex]|uniref:lanC-like protein 2 n=1 Tax=Anabrus simplex TaxID=316456 RepID=UPI0035A322F3
MGEPKEIPNNYKDYKHQDGEEVPNPRLALHVESSSSKLLEKLESQLRKVSNLDDVSVYTGSSGIALLYFMLGNKVNPSYYDKALTVIKQAFPLLKKRRVSFLNGDAGPLALGAVLNFRLGDNKSAAKLVAKLTGSLLHEALDSRVPDEILYGRAGYLYSLLFVNKHMGRDTVPVSTIRNVITAILNSGKELALHEHVRCPLMYQWHEKHYLGAAHGIAGILFMLLQAREYVSKSDMDKLILPTIDYVESLQFTSGNFPSSLETNKDKLVQWCHGAPGMVDLFSLAYHIFRKESYLTTALKCGELVWKRGILKKGYSICHGVSGNAYTFLRLYQETHDLKHLHRAYQFADWCTEYGKYQSHPPDRPLSMFEGIAGVVYFLIDIQHPNTAVFPAYVL